MQTTRTTKHENTDNKNQKTREYKQQEHQNWFPGRPQELQKITEKLEKVVPKGGPEKYLKNEPLFLQKNGKSWNFHQK